VRLPLAAKMAVLLALAAAGMVLFLLWHFGPLTSRSFQERGDVLVARSIDAMRGIAEYDTENSRQVLVDLIRHTTDARQRTLADLPFGLYRGDDEAIRAAIFEQDGARALRLQRNVDLLAREMTARAERRIEGVLDRLGQEQRALGETFAGEVRRSYLWLVGGVLGGLLLLLGAGLYGFVVRPVRELRRATQAVRAGNLDVETPRGGGDEVGALAADFGGMVEQLRASRRELQEWNQKLESEVARKTEHLRKAQGQLVQAEKMASLGTLAGGVAHEFNNIIGGIRGCAREALADESDAARREPLEIIARAAERGASVTEQLLAFSRRRVGDPQRVDLREVLDEVVALVEPELRRRGIALERATPEPLPIWADPGGVHQVLLNLLRNGMQSMVSGGTLRIAGAARAGASVLEVRDSGCGIDPAHLDRVFEPFFTTKDHEEDPRQRGSGLGLAVSYGIVEAHGGNLSVASTPGEGAVFTLELPAPSR